MLLKVIGVVVLTVWTVVGINVLRHWNENYD